MRQIKFRAWDKDYNYMIEPDDIYPRVMSECITGDGKVLEIIENSSYLGTDTSYEDISDKRILMQYTGLKDCEGKEIFECDIFKDNVGLGVVEYKDGAYRVNYRNGICKWFIDYLDSERKTIEVIGNIYENPELIK